MYEYHGLSIFPIHQVAREIIVCLADDEMRQGNRLALESPLTFVNVVCHFVMSSI